MTCPRAHCPACGQGECHVETVWVAMRERPEDGEMPRLVTMPMPVTTCLSCGVSVVGDPCDDSPFPAFAMRPVEVAS